MAVEESHYRKVDVLVARSPCGVKISEGKGGRDVFRLQINLIVADLALKNSDQANDNSVFVAFTGQCEPMLEISSVMILYPTVMIFGFTSLT